YEGWFRDAVLKGKALPGEYLLEFLGEELARHLETQSAPKFDIITPVPLHWTRRFTRGYNQAFAIASGVARTLQTPLREHAVRRIRATAAQSGLSGPARRANVQGAFAAGHTSIVQGLRVLVVDDVVTTAATMNEIAAVLFGAGAAQVSVAAIAHR
ncbi:MAG: ComF family protein, partial [Gemmataceae bacterium]